MVVVVCVSWWSREDFRGVSVCVGRVEKEMENLVEGRVLSVF